MAKIQIISKKHTPFEDFFSIMEQFDASRIQQASAKLRNVFVKALLWC